MSTIHEIARDFTAMLRSGKFAAAGERYWADDVTSTEPMDLPGSFPAVVSGIEATLSKCDVRFNAAGIDDLTIDGPFVTGNQFALFIDMMIVGGVDRATSPFSAIALYTVRDGRISEESYFYD